jgi:hypothetical protein
MFSIDNTLVSEALLKEEFTCDLERCKGACCVEGEAGAPLTKEETEALKQHFSERRRLKRRERTSVQKKAFMKPH